jgi:hypothetical protein
MNNEGDYNSPQKTRLEKIGEKLYSNSSFDAGLKRSRIRTIEKIAKDSWEEKKIEEPKEEVVVQKESGKKFSFFSRFVFIFSLIVFFLAGGYAFYQINFGTPTASSDNVDIILDAPSFAEGGEAFTLGVAVTNRNGSPIDQADVVIEYPKGESLDAKNDLVTSRILLGSVPSGGFGKTSQDIILYGKEGNERQIKVRVEFTIPGSTTLFTKEAFYKISLKSSPLLIAVSTLKEAASNQEVLVTAEVQAIKGNALRNVLVKAEYPLGFKFLSSEPSPLMGENVWMFDKIEKGDTPAIRVRGIIRGEDSDEKVFRFSAGSPSLTNENDIGVVYAEEKSSLLIQKPFIALSPSITSAKLNESGEYVVSSGQNQRIVFTYKNNLSNAINDIVIKTKLSGEILNRKSVLAPQGYFDSATNTIIWDKTTMPKLANILPGDGGELYFSFDILPLTGRTRGVYTAPTVTLENKISGKRLSDVDVPEDIVTSAPIVMKVLTESRLTGAYALAAGSPGLTAEKESVYTVTYSVVNYSNEIGNASLRFFLGPGVSYLDDGQGEGLRYVASEKSLLWSGGSIPRGAGVLSGVKKEVSFKVVAKPSITQAGQSMTLVKSASLEGTDTFTGTPVFVEGSSVTTRESVSN